MTNMLERHAQLIAAIALRLPERSVGLGAAARLAYLVDREMMRAHRFPLTEGRRVSTGEGALSLSLLKTFRAGYNPLIGTIGDGETKRLFSVADGDTCSVHPSVNEGDLDCFSIAEMRVIEDVLALWGALDVGELDSAMSNAASFPELEGMPWGTDISEGSILHAVGDEDPDDSVERLEESRRIDDSFDLMRSF